MPKLSEIMSRDVVMIGPQASLRELVGVLRDEKVSGVPVVRGGRLVGVVSATDLLDFEFEQPPEEVPAWEAVEGRDDSDTVPGYYVGTWDVSMDVLARIHRQEDPEWDRLMEHAVSEVMTPVIHSLPPHEDVRSAAAYMVRHDIHRVLVLEGDDLVGIVSALDIVRAVAVGIL